MPDSLSLVSVGATSSYDEADVLTASTQAMVYSAVLQVYINKSSPCHNNQPSACTKEDGTPNPAPLNVWIVSGPYIMVGISEIFASITSLEYAFTKVRFCPPVPRGACLKLFDPF